ncbi:type II toxin-antitoxin system Phd/YefM family antitoxin [Apilactobacillus timberlakei]|uniref:type II toxin-antitoxin system Phd/YefM family antitoxin n=1 Tax=Apilactobacillus timberlakei TaxID=2008380 RepID=UPI00112A1260|nr:type II toxin-antitoxin system Phd/YefM family antitoxin [Apilactobacillus timberlakei]TPR18021.1 type II toxin-antitoxin system Phd/YefM family antitoxin [Apilactobacillus timberlakei]TPR19823.1 type II toxin-antitoxin system Phd/YefM family antitoxin [Apilactobacillus timberlakei]TPR21361.1 type II toxin-antitoxin system Phd/YefM family antitoxin [Apilactobacillus timberlakei]TPR23409.1 type II toxin-antitoxin system Phd/YefM family antitoxin [Apilactobacillus timberlakei]
MALAITQSTFRTQLKKYLDQINEDNETVYVTRSNNSSVAVVNQDKLNWLERYARSEEGSKEHAIARDQLIRQKIIAPDPIVKSNDDYWSQFNG